MRPPGRAAQPVLNPVSRALGTETLSPQPSSLRAFPALTTDGQGPPEMKSQGAPGTKVKDQTPESGGLDPYLPWTKSSELPITKGIQAFLFYVVHGPSLDKEKHKNRAGLRLRALLSGGASAQSRTSAAATQGSVHMLPVK